MFRRTKISQNINNCDHEYQKNFKNVSNRKKGLDQINLYLSNGNEK